MSSTKFAPPLTLRINVPRLLISLLVLIHIGACGLLLVLPLTLIFSLFLAFLLLVNLFVVLNRLPGLPRPGNIHTVEWRSDGSWFIKTFAGDQLAAHMQRTGFVHPWLVILAFQVEGDGGVRSVVLFPDSLDRDSFRQLCVRLKVVGANVAVS